MDTPSGGDVTQVFPSVVQQYDSMFASAVRLCRRELVGDTLRLIVPRRMPILVEDLRERLELLTDAAQESCRRPILVEIILEPAAAETSSDDDRHQKPQPDLSDARAAGVAAARAKTSNMSAAAVPRAECRRQFIEERQAEKRSTRFDSDRLWQELRANPRRAFEVVFGTSLVDKRGHKEPLVLCPWHDDHNPSLSINLEKLACYCHVCGKGTGITHLAKHVWGLDYAAVMRRFEEAFGVSSNGSKPKTDRKLLRNVRYEIRDLQGELKATHFRHEYSDGSKDMPWEPSGVKTAELPLFQIEKTVDSGDGETVVVCEGEKAAAALWERRVLAVGTVTGASGTPCDAALEPLKRFRVLLWPDNDQAGHGHMSRIGQRLRALGHLPEMLRLVDWEGAPPKGDAADFDGDIDAVLERAPVFGSDLPVPSSDGAEVPAIVDPYKDRRPVEAYAAWQVMSTEPRVYPTAGLVRAGGTAAISGLIGAGKTTLMLNWVRGWAVGKPVLGRDCTSCRVLVVVSPKEYDNWVETIGLWEIRDRVFIVESTKGHFGDPDQQAVWFDTMMQENECQAFALDTLFDFYGHPPNSPGDQNRIVMNEQAPLIQCVRERRYFGIVGGHQGKSEAQALIPRDPEEAFAGHTGWMAQHRMRITLRRKSKHNAAPVIAILTGRGGYGDEGILTEQLLAYDPETRLVKLDGPFFEHLGKTAMPEIVEALRAFRGWMPMSKLLKETNKGEAWVRAGLKAGVEAKVIQPNKKKTRGKAWILKEFLSQQDLSALLEKPNGDEK
jgi:hypothetical protein